MNEERLSQLLRRADGEAAACDGKAFAKRSRETAMGRRRTRRAASVLGAMIAVMIGWWSVMMFSRKPTAEPVVVTTKDAGPVIGNTDRMPTAMSDLEVLDPVWQARDEAACTMVFMAGRREARVDRNETKKQYQRVMALFPESSWAQVARKENERLEKQD